MFNFYYNSRISASIFCVNIQYRSKKTLTELISRQSKGRIDLLLEISRRLVLGESQRLKHLDFINIDSIFKNGQDF